MKLFSFLLTLLLSISLNAQTIEFQLKNLYGEVEALHKKEEKLSGKIEELKLKRIREDLAQSGLPKLQASEETISHAAMTLVYSEEHEQAKWVAHIITPDVIKGAVGRTNDFRKDPLLKTGSTEEKDYFLKTMRPDSIYEYDGFGFDRGHLAPSADFRWSKNALSESYFYSNMSPQCPDFNRGVWADLEGTIRSYIAENPKSQLFVVTGPILKPDLPKIERSVNNVSIPEEYFKVVVDLKAETGIGFIIANKATDDLPEVFATTIDKVEEATGLDLYHALPHGIEEKIEAAFSPKKWIPELQKGDVMAMDPRDLSTGQINTRSAKTWMGSNRKIEVCGTVVAGRVSGKGNVLLNLDKRFPNQVNCRQSTEGIVTS